MKNLTVLLKSNKTGEILIGLITYESGWVKNGHYSVGVGRQHCGNVGKLSNSQVAGFAALNNGDFGSMVDARLFLSEDWCADSKRCYQAGIPASERNFKTKLEIAFELIEQCIDLQTKNLSITPPPESFPHPPCVSV